MTEEKWQPPAVRFMEKHQWKLLHFAAYTDWPEETIKVLLKTIQIPNPSNIDIDELAEVISQLNKNLGGTRISTLGYFMHVKIR